MDNFDFDKEVDVSTILKQPASELATVQNLDSTLEKFGFKKDDRIDRRDVVKMYTSVENEMEKEIHSLAHTGQYNNAKEMRGRLDNLRKEFDHLQIDAVKRMKDDQYIAFDKGSKDLKTSLISTLKQDKISLEEEIDRMMENLENTHQIQLENLDKELRRIPRPAMKYSRRLIELFKAEEGLIKLDEFEEAQKVRVVIDRMLPKEERRFYKAFDEKLAARLQQLKDNQTEERSRLMEKTKGMQWTEARRREKEMKILEQKVVNNSRDMDHAYHLVAKLKPEMSVAPSALWQKRPNYDTTHSTMRGSQMLNKVHGLNNTSSSSNKGVYAASLVERHNFLAPLNGTMTI